MGLLEPPAAFVQRLRQILPGSGWSSYWSRFHAPRPATFRINPLREDPAVILEQLQLGPLQPIDWCPGAYRLPPDRRDALTESEAVEQGRIYVQNPASMLPPLLLAPQPGQEVLDLAAAPGGKTIHLAALMENQGRLAAVEAVRSRFYKLRETLQRYGVTIAHTYLTDGRSVGRKTTDRFDLVLLDAPCSGEARFHATRPGSWAYWGERKIREQSRKQKGLLRSALHAVQPGGTVLYCTCSFAPEENEQVVHDQLRRFGDAVTVEPIELPAGVNNVQSGLLQWQGKTFHPSLEHARRLLPDEIMDGFFLCLLRKRTRLRQVR